MSRASAFCTRFSGAKHIVGVGHGKRANQWLRTQAILGQLGDLEVGG